MPDLAFATDRCPDYLSSSLVRPPAIMQPYEQTAACGSDLKQARSLDASLRMAEDTLLDWFRDPLALEDDETNAPTLETLGSALKLLGRLRSAAQDGTLPFSLTGVTVGSGGSISFELARGETAVTVVVGPDGSCERLIFVGNQLIRRDPIPTS